VLACFLSHAARSQDTAAAASDPAQWRQLALERAIGAAEQIADPYRRAETFASIAKAQIVVGVTPHGAIAQALAAAQKVSQAEFKGWVLHEIVLAQIAADDVIGARQTLDLITADRPHGAAAAALAHVQIRGNNLSAAQATAMSMRDTVAQGEILRQIAAIQAARGQLDAALETARPIRDGFYQSVAFGDVAVAEIRRGNVQRAHDAAARARRFYRPQVYGRVVLARYERGDVSGALETLQKIDDDLYRAAVQGRITTAQDSGLTADHSKRMFTEALSLALAVPDKEPRKGVVLSQLARMQAISGDAVQAREILSQALSAANALTQGPDRDDALEAIARSFVRAGDMSGAFSTATLVAERTTRALLIRDIVMMQGEDEAAVLEAIRSAGLGDPLAETAALFGVLGAQLTRSGRAVSLATIDAACEAVRSIQEVQLKPAAFSALAAARVNSGDLNGGWAIFQEAISVAEQVDRPDQRAAAYVRVINALNDRLMFLGQPAQRPKEDSGAE
jgi:tetratricopeptide (TPR) repeat protein